MRDTYTHHIQPSPREEGMEPQLSQDTAQFSLSQPSRPGRYSQGGHRQGLYLNSRQERKGWGQFWESGSYDIPHSQSSVEVGRTLGSSGFSAIWKAEIADYKFKASLGKLVRACYTK